MPTKFLAALALALTVAVPAYAQNYELQYNLLGVTPALQAQANSGKGVVFGVIDTGVQSQWIGFQNRIDVTNSACEIAGCSKTLAVNDDNGHGTFVASEIMGYVSGHYYGIDPAASLIAVKALNSQGSGLVSDVANGIDYAVNKGAKILNLSMTFVPTAQLISAINYAASKGTLIVFAGGNDGASFQAGKNVGGLTDTAIQDLVLMGSTNSSKGVSYFSSKPGAGGFISTSGKFYAYSSRWMMADGEYLYGASTYHDSSGYDFLTQMSGTSMAAPQAAGVAGLLAARWPFLLTNNTLASVMLQSTQDLGAKGVDAIYGDGFLRVDQAFNPIGTLTIPVNGQNIPVSQAQLQVNGTANGQAIKAILAKGVGYDNFKRDFKLNLGSAISTPSPNTGSGSGLNPNSWAAISAGLLSGRSFTDLGDGSWVASSYAQFAPSSTLPSEMNRGGLTQDPTRGASDDWSIGFYSEGTYMGAGHGNGAAYSFNDARWEGKTAFFDTQLAGAGSILALDNGTGYAAGGFAIGDHERVAFAVTMGQDQTESMLMGNQISSQGFAVGYTFEPSKDWDVSLTSAFLKEKNALLGSPSGGFLRLGENTTSMAVGISSNLNMGDGFQLGFDAMMLSTDPGSNPDSLITHTSRLTATSLGVAMRKDNLTGRGDTLIASIKQPLRIVSGEADIHLPTGTDSLGNPVFSNEKAGLTPGGVETDFALGYTTPVAENTKVSAAFEFRNDADNVPGAIDHAVVLRLTEGF